ncbi:hypothetical protein EsH8_III_000381 [Colletotrichum jinshuiense]
MATSNLEAKIRQAAVQNRHLLSVLAETDNAVPDLTQQRRLIAELEAQLRESDRDLRGLNTQRKKELKGLEKHRDSVMRRLVHKAVGKSGKFDEKAAREEREYFDVLREEHREKELNESLRQQLVEAENAGRGLEAEAARHEDAQRALDSLYDSIFSGPAPSYPEENALARRAGRAQVAYHDTRSRAEAEQHAARLLSEAMRRMGDALRHTDDALGRPRMDMFGGGGTMTDMMEHGGLQRAEAAAEEARVLVAQARRMTPYIVGDLPPVSISHGSLVGDVLFDNIFTDRAFHDEIQKSRMSIDHCARVLSRFLHETKERHAQLARELRGRQDKLEDTRWALQKERERLFEQIAGSNEEMSRPIRVGLKQ